MTCASKRGVRRSTLAGKDKRKLPTLDGIVSELAKAKRPCRLEGRQIGRRVLTQVIEGGGVRSLAFRHPTKKATAGRYAVLHLWPR